MVITPAASVGLRPFFPSMTHQVDRTSAAEKLYTRRTQSKSDELSGACLWTRNILKLWSLLLVPGAAIVASPAASIASDSHDLLGRLPAESEGTPRPLNPPLEGPLVYSASQMNCRR